MNPLGVSVVLGLLVGVWAQVNVQRPLCDSPEVEDAALVARDYLNGQHTHGYKYELNRIEDVKVYSEVSQQRRCVVTGKDILRWSQQHTLHIPLIKLVYIQENKNVYNFRNSNRIILYSQFYSVSPHIKI